MTLRRYERYKDSGVAWLGPVPAHWEVLPIKRLLLSIEQGWSPQCENFPADPGQWGVLKVGCVNGGRFNADENKALPEDLEPIPELAICRGDVLVSRANTRDLVGSVAVVERDYEKLLLCDKLYRLRVMADRCEPTFLAHFVGGSAARSVIEAAATGASSSMLNIGQGAIICMPIALPPLQEQRALLRFLDHETAKIDALIAEQQRLIELLTEKRQAVIARSVTKGLDPAAPMKDSGIKWLGEVPAHWTGTRMKSLFRQAKRQGHLGRDVLSVYRDYGVILKDSRTNNFNKTPEDLSLYQLVEPGDLVVNKMKAWQGSLGVSALTGITSPDYVVFLPLHREVAGYLHYLLRSSAMVSTYRAISNGIRLAQWRLEPEAFLAQTVFIPPDCEQRAICSLQRLRLASPRSRATMQPTACPEYVESVMEKNPYCTLNSEL